MVLVAIAVAVPLTYALAVWLAPPEPDVPAAPAGIAKILVERPTDGAVYPPEIAAPTFLWQDETPDAAMWSIRIDFDDQQPGLQFDCREREWTPGDDDWETIKRRSVAGPAHVTIEGSSGQFAAPALSRGHVSIRTSEDEVGAPIFYREVNLPFAEAVKNPGKYIRWRFGSVASREQPPVVLERLFVCGNCHSFSADAKVMGMDVDYGSDKGSYAICQVGEEIRLSNDKIITWSDYRREDGKKTFGLLSQVSPDGRYVVSTVKDLSVFQAVDNLTFSQLFFPIRGILCIYDRQTEEYHALPGADDERYVQSNPTWSPDGKYIVFARSDAYHGKAPRVNELGLTRAEETAAFLAERKTFRYDLYRIPFNGGAGGKAEPLAGASHNGRSNYFARYSPDGRWIVFCQANSFMLLQLDSQLCIIPAEGGEARRLECNTSRMNSWHSWSPNGRWLVFSSKAYTPYTQLFLSHMDDQGHASPAVVLSHFTAPDRAANIPEFVNADPGAIDHIVSDFIEDLYHVEAADKYARVGDYASAVSEIKKAVAIKPENADTYRLWGVILMSQGKFTEAEQRIRKTIELEPEHRLAHWNLGRVAELQGRRDQAIEHYQKAIEVDPFFVSARLDCANLLLEAGQIDAAIEHLDEAARLEPKNPAPCFVLGDYYTGRGRLDAAIDAYRRALQCDPNSVDALWRTASLLVAEPKSDLYDTDLAMRLAVKACKLCKEQDPNALIAYAEVLAAQGSRREALASAQTALRLAEGSKDTKLIARIQAKLERLE